LGLDKDVRIATYVVADTLLLENQSVYALIDFGATHFFVVRKIENKLKRKSLKLEKRFLISTHLGDVVTIEHIYKVVKITIGGYDTKVDVMPL